ncbi:MAG TPA: metallophosphoesterase family protein [Tepidisphaeraceae bacterium]|jgi:Icc-related predicted phosphoesterase|nr:metallophosphoesterase family protein [Tepidisphaeraceae bacterium]
MKLLLFSDIHNDLSAARALVKRAAEVDVVIGAGDIGNLRGSLEGVISVLQKIARPTVLVAGNNESTGELAAACGGWRQAHVLHGNSAEIDGVSFFGIGGGIPVTPFGSWSYDFTEAQATQLLAKCPAECVLVSHSPPKGVVDRSSRGDSLGSTAVRETILRCRPKLVVCGHIHGSGGDCEFLGTTPVVNAGPGGMIWDLERAMPC